MNEGELLNKDNGAALIGHLVDGSLTHQLVICASAAATRDEAKTALAKLVQDRIDATQEALDAAD